MRVRCVTAHRLRHTAASLAIASGADVKAVQQMLGHASATMTLDTYGHLFEDSFDEVGNAMGAARNASRRRRTLFILSPQCCPSPIRQEVAKGPCSGSPLAKTPFNTAPPTGFEPVLPP
jgi:Phage integrase family